MDYCSDLVNAFNTLITNDKDKILKDMLTFLQNTNIDKPSAQFYLDMTNWNLAQAVEAYFSNDCQLYQNFILYEVTQIFDSIEEVHPENITKFALNHEDNTESLPKRNTTVETDTHFNYNCIVKNTGAYKWPEETQLSYFAGEENVFNTSYERFKKFDIPCLEVGGIFKVTLLLKSPKNPGSYRTLFKLWSNGYSFGDEIELNLTTIPKNSDTNIINSINIPNLPTDAINNSVLIQNPENSENGKDESNASMMM